MNNFDFVFDCNVIESHQGYLITFTHMVSGINSSHFHCAGVWYRNWGGGHLLLCVQNVFDGFLDVHFPARTRRVPANSDQWAPKPSNVSITPSPAA